MFTVEIKIGSVWLFDSRHDDENKARSIAAAYCSKQAREARVLDSGGAVISWRMPVQKGAAA